MYRGADTDLTKRESRTWAHASQALHDVSLDTDMISYMMKLVEPRLTGHKIVTTT